MERGSRGGEVVSEIEVCDGGRSRNGGGELEREMCACVRVESERERVCG